MRRQHFHMIAILIVVLAMLPVIFMMKALFGGEAMGLAIIFGGVAGWFSADFADWLYEKNNT